MKTEQEYSKLCKPQIEFLGNGEPYIILAAEAHNSASSSAEYMKNVWEKADILNCNTILAPVYWEKFEPEERKFSYELIEQLICGAREHGKKLILLWFGSWKNGLSTYAPAWIKTDTVRFPRVTDCNGTKLRILSMFESDIFEVEKNAFEHFMGYLKEFDAKERTVIAVQVENEVGVLGAARDFSQGAQDAFKEDVPEVMSSDRKSWNEIFGTDAGEAFMCYHYADYMSRLAQAGKKVYHLPMFTNVWLKDRNQKPGEYPCGGPEPEMLDLWKKAAPCLDFIAPDIYSFDFEKIAELYNREDNLFFVPETRRDKWAPANLYNAIGKYQAYGYSPFGAESIGENKSFITQIDHTDSSDKNVSSEKILDYLAESYKLIGNMMPVLTKYYGTDDMTGFTQHQGEMTRIICLGEYRIRLYFYHRIDDDEEYIPAAGIILKEADNKLLFAGYGYRAEVEKIDSEKQLDYLSLEKGTFNENADWIKLLDCNGDEQNIRMEEKPTILRVWSYEY